MSNVTAITLFAGAGGWDLGFAACGVPILAALNHNERSLATHALNFPETEHIKTDITQENPRRFPHATILQASPECRYQSASHGVKLLGQNQPGLWTDREEDDPSERSRATMREVARWAAAKKEQGHPFQLIFVENVTKVRLWSGYHSWHQEMQALGYRAKTLYFNSMFAPAFPAPCHESRDRWYAVFWRASNRAPDLDIRPPAFCQHCSLLVDARQLWKRPQRPYGDYRKQYIYACPRCYREVIPFYHPASEALDWACPTPAIGDRAKPLAKATLAKIRKGVLRYRPSHRAFLYSYYGTAIYRTVSDPLGTCTTRDRHALITIPHPLACVEECGYRMLTLDEYKRAMGFPSSFRFQCSRTEALRQLGLAVTPAVAVVLVQRGLASLGYQLNKKGAA
jgi:DNA (cytosine-5)-methyltransferase 1